MSASQVGGPYDDASRNGAGHGQISLTLPPIRSLELSLPRPDQPQPNDSSGYSSGQTATSQSNEPFSSNPPRRESIYQWRPAGSYPDSNQAGPSTSASGRDVNSSFNRSYSSDSNYHQPLGRDQQSPTISQYRPSHGQPSYESHHEGVSPIESRGSGVRRAEPSYSPSHISAQESFGSTSESYGSRHPGRGAYIAEHSKWSFELILHASSGPYTSGTASGFAPSPLTGHTPSFPLPRQSFSVPAYPSTSSPTTYQSVSHRQDNTMASPVAGFGSHQAYGDPVHTPSPTTPYPSRPWPDRSYSASSVDLVPSRSAGSSGSAGAWPGTDLSSLHAHDARSGVRDYAGISSQPKDITRMSSFINEVRASSTSS